MTTNRTPIQRPARTMISSRAFELFVELERARRARRRAADCTVSEQSGYCTTNCRACRAWFDAHAALHSELRLPPWQWPCIPRNPFPPNSAMARDWSPAAEPLALWNLLDKARRGAVVPTASPSQEGDHPDAEPVAGPGTFI